VDDAGGRLFVCSDTDYCERRRAGGHRGAELAPDLAPDLVGDVA
jgi:alpha-D-ribose 1-methylphosphonate 5-phosphate C-P lyase